MPTNFVIILYRWAVVWALGFGGPDAKWRHCHRKNKPCCSEPCIYVLGMTIYTVKVAIYTVDFTFLPRALRAYPLCTFSTLFLYFLRCTSLTPQPYSTTLLTITAAHDHQLEHRRILILPAVYALPITQSSSFLPVLTRKASLRVSALCSLQCHGNHGLINSGHSYLPVSIQGGSHRIYSKSQPQEWIRPLHQAEHP